MGRTYHTLINVPDLIAMLQDDNTVVLDCRYYLNDISKGRKEYFLNHIPGAVYLDIGLDLSSPVIKGVTGRHPLPHPEVLASTLRGAGVNQESQVVVYDQYNGAYAARAWWLLYWLGHDPVAVLDGGFEAWRSKGLPLDNQWPPPVAGNFTVQLRSHLTIEMQEVTAGRSIIIDSREYKRYTGETEPIDPVAGHIPGALCIPYLDNTDEKGIWNSPEFLRKKFGEILTDDPISPVFYCGSGVTACHNILAYKMATGKDVLLYPGSWSEWIHYYPPVIGEEPG